MKSEFKPRLLLFKGRGILSWFIRWQTRSCYSHAALMLPDGSVIEAWHGAGVRRTWLRDWSGVDVFFVRDMTNEQWRTAIEFARTQIGKRFDWLGVLRFVSRFRQPDNERWFCSELVFASLAKAGVELLRDTDPGEVSPGMLARSPLLQTTSP